MLERLPVVRAGDTGTIAFSYCNGCRNGARRHDHALAKADTIAGAGDDCQTLPHVLREFWGRWRRWAGPANHSLLRMTTVFVITLFLHYCCVLLHIY